MNDKIEKALLLLAILAFALFLLHCRNENERAEQFRNEQIGAKP